MMMPINLDQIAVKRPEPSYKACSNLSLCQSGFSLVELITIIVIIGIISAIAIPRMFDRGAFDSRGFYDQTLSTLRYAQKSAISHRRLVCVTFPAANQMQLRIASAFGAGVCDTDLQNPANVYPPGFTTYTIENLNGVTLTGTPFNFDALGRPSAPAFIVVSGYATARVCVAPETGYVYGQAVC